MTFVDFYQWHGTNIPHHHLLTNLVSSSTCASCALFSYLSFSSFTFFMFLPSAGISRWNMQVSPCCTSEGSFILPYIEANSRELSAHPFWSSNKSMPSILSPLLLVWRTTLLHLQTPRSTTQLLHPRATSAMIHPAIALIQHHLQDSSSASSTSTIVHYTTIAMTFIHIHHHETVWDLHMHSISPLPPHCITPPSQNHTTSQHSTA